MSFKKGVDSMLFQLEDKLPNLVREGILNRFITEIVTETKHTSKEARITGNLIITRDFRVPNDNSEITIKKKFPIDIQIPNKLVNGSEICIYIKTYNLVFKEDFTEINADIEVTNVGENANQLV